MDSNIKAEKKTSSSGNGKMEDDEAKKIVESITDSITSGEKRDIEESTKDIVRRAAMAVGSLKETEFDIRFNPDVFSPGVKHAPGERDSYKKQIALIRDASDFLITTQIPAFIRDCLDHSSVPMDGQTLADNLHNRGINIRYLGVIANMLSKVPQLCYIHSITGQSGFNRYLYKSSLFLLFFLQLGRLLTTNKKKKKKNSGTYSKIEKEGGNGPIDSRAIGMLSDCKIDLVFEIIT